MLPSPGTGQVVRSACSKSTRLTYVWSERSRSLNMTSSSGDPRYFTAARGALTPGRTYNFSVVVTDENRLSGWASAVVSREIDLFAPPYHLV
jgi:hypothetical protein